MTAQPQPAHELIDRIPPADEVRERLGWNRRERKLLLKMLRLAEQVDRERTAGKREVAHVA